MTKTVAPPLAYSVPAAAAATSLSATHLREAIAKGQLTAKRSSKDDEGEPTGRWIILAADLQAYLDGLPEG